MKRTFNTLFMLESLDGKISTGSTDNLDVDKDFPKITGVKEGLHQYYDVEKTTDPFSLNSGRTMVKIGANTKTNEPIKMGCSFIIIDNKPHLNEKGVEYMSKWVKKLFLVTTNKNHPAHGLTDKFNNIEIISYENEINFTDLFEKLNSVYGIERITIQSGGDLNSEFVRQGLVDEVSIVVAPCLVGGKETQSLVGGKSFTTDEDLVKIKALKLLGCKVLEDSYLHLRYKVIN